MRLVFALIVLMASMNACSQSSSKEQTMNKSDDSLWKQKLSPDQYHILREKGTERPFTGEYDKFYETGTYHCAGCGTKLFNSTTKFNSGCGWPSFYAPLLENNININIDRSHGMVREEVTCSHCDGHLGHVFNDGPPPTGLRYCINSSALKFIEE